MSIVTENVAANLFVVFVVFHTSTKIRCFAGNEFVKLMNNMFTDIKKTKLSLTIEC